MFQHQEPPKQRKAQLTESALAYLGKDELQGVSLKYEFIVESGGQVGRLGSRRES